MQSETDAPFDPFRLRATVALRDAATERALDLGVDARPTAGMYRLGGSPDVPDRIAILQANAAGGGYSSVRGTLTITESSEHEIAGTFEADLRCCYNPYANIPARSARASGQFRTVPDPLYLRAAMP